MYDGVGTDLPLWPLPGPILYYLSSRVGRSLSLTIPIVTCIFKSTLLLTRINTHIQLSSIYHQHSHYTVSCRDKEHFLTKYSFSVWLKLYVNYHVTGCKTVGNLLMLLKQKKNRSQSPHLRGSLLPPMTLSLSQAYMPHSMHYSNHLSRQFSWRRK